MNGHIFLPLTFVFFGAFFLLRNTGLLPLPDVAWSFAWPVILMVLGVAFLLTMPSKKSWVGGWSLFEAPKKSRR